MDGAGGIRAKLVDLAHAAAFGDDASVAYLHTLNSGGFALTDRSPLARLNHPKSTLGMCLRTKPHLYCSALPLQLAVLYQTAQNRDDGSLRIFSRERRSH